MTYIANVIDMKKETIKEFGKLSFDLAKILLALGFLTPIFSEKPISFAKMLTTVLLVIILIIAGGFLLNKGVKNNG